jgi:hypothetical protein
VLINAQTKEPKVLARLILISILKMSEFWSSLHSKTNQKTIEIRETSGKRNRSSQESSSSESESSSSESSDDEYENRRTRLRARKQTTARTGTQRSDSPAFDSHEYNDEQLYDFYCESVRLENPIARKRHYGSQKKVGLGNTMNTKKLVAKRMKPPDLHKLLLTSKDQLFFIKYEPQGTNGIKWYLVQVDMESTKQVNPTFNENGQYYCVFLAKHADDKHLEDDQCRWWPEWYRYKRVKEKGEDVIVYGDRVLIQPHLTPDHKKFIQWATVFDLSTTECRMMGPFNFEDVTEENRNKSKVPWKSWEELYNLCRHFHLTPPRLSWKDFNGKG